jgi:hypothetical protein
MTRLSMLRSVGVQSCPQQVHDLVARQHTVGVGRKHLEQVELAGGKLAGCAGSRPELPLGNIQDPSLEGQRTVAARYAGPGGTLAAGDRTAQHRPHARHNLAQLKRLRNVIVGPELQTHDPVDGVALARHHDDRHRRSCADLAADGEAVAVGQLEVERNEIERAGSQAFHYLGP